jgi:hypothetical protein
MVGYVEVGTEPVGQAVQFPARPVEYVPAELSANTTGFRPPCGGVRQSQRIIDFTNQLVQLEAPAKLNLPASQVKQP